MARLVPLLLLTLGPVAALRAQAPSLIVQQSGSTALFQAVSVSARDPKVAWISGHRGSYAITTDAGATWQAHVVPGRDSLQFRDLHAIDARRAWLMAAGNGEKSGIFQTTDGGTTWAPVFVNRDTAAFYDCMAFWDDRRGFAFSDAVDGRIPVVRTANGRTWTPTTIEGQAGEGGFAASGTCAVTSTAGDAWIATGSGAAPRVLHSVDQGGSWTAATLPLAAGSGAGATGVAFRDRMHGLAVGGVIGGTGSGPRVARTADGGRSWTVVAEPSFAGAIYGVAYATLPSGSVAVAVGPGGAAFTRDDGQTWQPLDGEAYWSVGFGPDGAGWMVGPKGRVVRIEWH
ncbi:MAG: hypothetical protein IT355_17375 [Gemmatimonadaceae bacterium]|nr:hypothetical protein [Gemmatimonadaceae bacterium]